MNKQLILVSILTAILLVSLVSNAELNASHRKNRDGTVKIEPYFIVIRVIMYDNPDCIRQTIDEIYWRVSSGYKDPTTGEHVHLVAKGDIHNPADEVQKLLDQGKPPVIVVKTSFKKERVTDGQLRSYIEGLKDEIEIFDQYKRPLTQFELIRHQYTFTFGVNLPNC